MPKENNDSNEVAYLLKDGKVTKYMVIKIVYLLHQGEKQQNCYLTVKPNSIVMLHNHPGSLVFLYRLVFIYI